MMALVRARVKLLISYGRHYAGALWCNFGYLFGIKHRCGHVNPAWIM